MLRTLIALVFQPRVDSSNEALFSNKLGITPALTFAFLWVAYLSFEKRGPCDRSL